MMYFGQRSVPCHFQMNVLRSNPWFTLSFPPLRQSSTESAPSIWILELGQAPDDPHGHVSWMKNKLLF